MRKQIGALAALFLLAHLASLPPTLEDIDSINFALGVRDFDVALHQPHPPGYPVFIAFAKLFTGVLGAVAVPETVVRALSVLSAVAGAALVVCLFALYRSLAGDVRVAWWAMAVAVCSPLFWFTALRPLSDTTGLAFAAGAQLLLLRALGDAVAPVAGAAPGVPGLFAGPRGMLLGGAFLAGLGAGVRVQAAVLTAPLFVAAITWPGSRLSVRDRVLAAVAALAGVVVWGTPLIVSSGGVAGYVDALSFQAGSDFSDVQMLWTTPRPRVAVNAALNSFVWPWASPALGATVLVLATAGFGRAVRRAPRIAALLAIAFAPYAVFHLLFQDTPHVRYALPLVVPVAFLAVYAVAGFGKFVLAGTGLSLAVASLAVTLPAARAYARDGSPAFRMFEALAVEAPSGESGPPGVISMHAVMRRIEEWERDGHDGRVIHGVRGLEWLTLIDHWRREPRSTVRFLADPRRTDLALFDPRTRTLDRAGRWTLPEMPFLAGIRPGPADLYTLRPPGWMLDRGWSLTAEVGGVTAREGLGPHVQPSVAWVRARAEPAALLVGGRNLGGAEDPTARLTISAESGTIGTWDARPGFFLWQVPLPAGSILGSGYLPVRISAAAADGSGRQVRISLEQFDLQSDGVVMLGFADGWHEPEYEPSSGRSWRWASERARVWVRPVGRDVRVTIAGESPLRYFERAPSVRVLAAGVELSRFSPSSDFSHEVLVPAKALAVSGGLLTLESDLWFAPADRGENPDRRHLALRIYSVNAR